MRRTIHNCCVRLHVLMLHQTLGRLHFRTWSLRNCMAVSINVNGATFRVLGQPGRHSVEQDLSVIKTLYEVLLNLWTQRLR